MRSPIEMNARVGMDSPRGRLGELVARVATAMRRLLETYILVPLFAALLIASIWTAVLHLIAVEGAIAQGAAADLSRELSDMYEAQMAHNLVTIDQTLKMVQCVYGMKGVGGPPRCRTRAFCPRRSCSR